MSRLAMSSRTRIEVGLASARRSRGYRPACQPLEDRRLLSVTLSTGGGAASPVGAPVDLRAAASGHGATPVYQFRVGPTGGPSQVVRDFGPSANFDWAPLREGTYDVSVTVKDNFGPSAGETATTTYTVVSRVSGPGAVVSPTSNPLVALYSAPASPGGTMMVQFKLARSSGGWQTTSPQTVVPGTSTNVLVAGLLPGKVYLMRHVLSDGTVSAPTGFRAGRLPANRKFPGFVVQKRPTTGADVSQNVVFHVGINQQPRTIDTVATDRAGRVLWYYDQVAHAFPSYAPSLVPGGTVLLLGGNLGVASQASTIREVDLAGDTLRETNVSAVNAQLAALGKPTITDFNHDAQRLPNGDTAVLATTPRTVLHGGSPTKYNGDMVIVLDPNFQVAWTWDPFAFLDTNRLPTLGEGPSDWMHANSVAYSPADGNLIVSIRAQDRVVKIDYANGAGDGHVIWSLGQGGDFTLKSATPTAWFSHQHDVTYADANTLTLFDNGNTRHVRNKNAHSRGQELVLDENAKTATLVVNADLGSYAQAVGSAQRLPNGNLAFTSGFVEQTIEVTPRGQKPFIQKMSLSGIEYRSYLYPGLYGNTA